MSETDFDPELGKRVKEARQFKEELRLRAKRKPDSPYIEPYVNNIEGSYDSLNEEVILSVLQEISRKKLEDGSNIPVIFVDWGGGIGTSARRIAKQLPNGVFIVTNLANKFVDSENVHFIQANASELLRQEIVLPDGRKIPLRGNLDFVHEMKMLEHDPIADTDMLVMGRMLSPYGIMILGRTTELMRTNERPGSLVEAGKRNLAKVGLQQVKDFGGRRFSYYDVYAKPQNPIANIKR